MDWNSARGNAMTEERKPREWKVSQDALDARRLMGTKGGKSKKQVEDIGDDSDGIADDSLWDAKPEE